MVNSGGEIEQFQHSYRNMGEKLKAGKNVLQSARLEGGQFGDASDVHMEGIPENCASMCHQFGRMCRSNCRDEEQVIVASSSSS